MGAPWASHWGTGPSRARARPLPPHMFWENFRALTDGGQFIEISKRAKTEHVGELVNTFYPTNDPQTIEFAKVISMNPPNTMTFVLGLTLQGHRDIGPLLPGGGAKLSPLTTLGVFPQAVSSPP